MPRSVTVLAPAKVNLFLHITGRRDDGFHLLDSLVAFADVGDLIRVTADDGAHGVSVHRHGPFAADLPDDASDDLVRRALQAFGKRFKAFGGAIDVDLDKRLPVAAGIGGGSADAAAVLRALDRLAGGVDAAGLHDVAVSLGADVPVCLACRPTIMRGIGERLTPVPALPELGIVLVNPRRHLATPEVFAHFAELAPGYRDTVDVATPGLGAAPRLLATLRATGNDLAVAATAALPIIADMLVALNGDDVCRLARMSGSGATCFGLFDTEAAAAAACARLAARHGDWWWAAGRLLSQAPAVRVANG